MAEKTKQKPLAFDIPTKKPEVKKTGLPPELEKKVKDAEKRLDAKPDAPKKEEKKSDVMIPMDSLPKEIEAEMKAFAQTVAISNKKFDTMITSYLDNSTNEYGISKDPSKVVKGLEKEMMKAFASVFKLPEKDIKDMESKLELGKGDTSPGMAYLWAFRMATGFDSELKEKLLQQETIDYNYAKKIVLGNLSERMPKILESESLSRFKAEVTNDNWRAFKGIPLLMAKKLGLDDKIKEDKIAHRMDVIGIYGQLFEDYAKRNWERYLN